MKGGIVRLNDKCSGHTCFPPRKSTSCSPDVMVEGDYVVRYGDTLETHRCPGGPAHGGVHIGEHDTIVNGKSIQLGGDPIDCGSVCDETCPSTICG
jgi:uncharacterized Zn-binding protein involved in type VI secretion